jgi:hypothetical protein
MKYLLLGKKLLIVVFVFLFTVFGIQSSYADYYPSGPTRDVSEQTLVNNGWVKTYEQTYATQILNDGTGLRPSGTYTILAGKSVGSNTISLLAAAPTADIFTQTTGNNTNLVNGTYWYYVPTINIAGGSIGFADTSTVILNTADSSSMDSLYRLSWHINYTTGGAGSNGGWRLGNITNLNDSGDYLKQVWTWSPVNVRRTTNLSFSESISGTDYLSDPDGELRKTVDQIMANYGSLIR